MLFTGEPAPFIDGVRINSPHYLCKMVNTGSNVYTLVISQYEKNNTIHYTLRVYATSEFKLTRVMNPYNPRYEKHVSNTTLLFVRNNNNLNFLASLLNRLYFGGM